MVLSCQDLAAKVSLVVVVVVIVGSSTTFLPDWNLDALSREAFAELGTVADTREFLRRIHLEDVAEDRGKNGRPATFDWKIALLAWRGLDVAEREPKSRRESQVNANPCLRFAGIHRGRKTRHT